MAVRLPLERLLYLTSLGQASPPQRTDLEYHTPGERLPGALDKSGKGLGLFRHICTGKGF